MNSVILFPDSSIQIRLTTNNQGTPHAFTRGNPGGPGHTANVQESNSSTVTPWPELLVMTVIQDTLAWVSELPPESGMDDAHQLLDCLSKTSASAVTE